MNPILLLILLAAAVGLGAVMLRYLNGKPNERLYVDDLRTAPDGSWDVVRTFHDAIVALESGRYTEVSLDHDLGCFYGYKEMTGRDVLNWLIARQNAGKRTPRTVRVHSANVVGVQTMEEDIARWWPK